MILKQLVALEISGKTFSPTRAGEMLGLRLEHASEPGDVGRGGRPQPDGGAVLSIEVERGPGLLTSCRPSLAELEALVAPLKQLGADQLVLSLGLFFDAQCNFEFRADELVALGRLANLGVVLTISCYQSEEPLASV